MSAQVAKKENIKGQLTPLKAVLPALQTVIIVIIPKLVQLAQKDSLNRKRAAFQVLKQTVIEWG